MSFKKDFNFDSVVSHAGNTDWYRDYLAHHESLRAIDVEQLMVEWIAFKTYVPHTSPEWQSCSCINMLI